MTKQNMAKPEERRTAVRAPERPAAVKRRIAHITLLFLDFITNYNILIIPFKYVNIRYQHKYLIS